jgi:hypothetical protein
MFEVMQNLCCLPGCEEAADVLLGDSGEAADIHLGSVW